MKCAIKNKIWAYMDDVHIVVRSEKKKDEVTVLNKNRQRDETQSNGQELWCQPGEWKSRWEGGYYLWRYTQVREKGFLPNKLKIQIKLCKQTINLFIPLVFFLIVANKNRYNIKPCFLIKYWEVNIYPPPRLHLIAILCMTNVKP